jgi:predicted DNA-binding mobile mystery protein A
MGKILGVSGVAITKLENRERDHSITLRDLEKAAALFQCRLAYALIPIDSLESSLRSQARKAAARLSEKADHAMKLEEQQVDRAELRAQVDVLARLLLESLDSRIWDPAEKGKK